MDLMPEIKVIVHREGEVEEALKDEEPKAKRKSKKAEEAAPAEAEAEATAEAPEATEA